jgi:hypothetical protein
VPAELWDGIRQGLEHPRQEQDFVSDLMDKLKGLFVFPRLVPVFASFLLMFLAGSVTLNTIHLRQAKEKDQGEYLVALLSPASSTSASDSNDGGTPIEHYFL